MKRHGTDISTPMIAKMLLGVMPEKTRQPFRMMVVLMSKTLPLESSEWAAMTADERSRTITNAMASMPEGFWDSGEE